MSTYSVILIGAGQLGSRHLQGLARGDLNLNITIVEPNYDNLQIALKRFNEVIPMQKILIVKTPASTEEIPPQSFDLAIIATNADIRAAITERLVYRHFIRYILFEKVAFQSEKQFESIINLLEGKEIKSWVNCARRYSPFYIVLREELIENCPLRLEVTGVEWGLACNAVHHIDLLSYLSGENIFHLCDSKFERGLYKSKRDGFMEFYGFFSGHSISENNFKLCCNRASETNEKPWAKIRIDFNETYILIDELAGHARFFNKGGIQPFRIETVKIIPQSALTNIQVFDIIKTGTALLPTLEESYESHKPLFLVFRKHYKNATGKKIENLPIT